MPEISADTKARNYFCDDAFNRDWLKAVPVIREAMGTGKKFGRFVTIDDRIVFTGGPGQGGGGASRGGGGTLKRATFGESDSVSADRACEFLGSPDTVNDWDERKKAKHTIVTTLSEETGVPYNEVNQVIATWAHTSNDSNPTSLTVQEEAAKIFGSPLSAWQQKNIENLPAYQKSDISRGNIRKVLHAMYDNTQKQLDAAGVPDPVTLYRGVKNVSLPKGKTKIYSNTLSSYSSSLHVSKNFAWDGTLMEIQIPRSRIIGSARTGFGCLGEYEFVVLGATSGAGDEVMVIE